jgi:hypothetical protein
MEPESIFLWISLIAAVPVAMAGLILRRSAIAQGLSLRRGIAGWALILAAVLMAVAAGYFFWRMASSAAECGRPVCGPWMECEVNSGCTEGLE